MAKSGLDTADSSAGRDIRVHIGIYGRCNVGKSSLLNAITATQTAIVSQHSGTTTDVVRKSYEIIDFAPVVFIDTAGVDDLSPLGEQRVARTLETINQIDLALLMFQQWGAPEAELAARFTAQAIPYIAVHNMVDKDVQFTDNKDVIAINARSCTPPERDSLLEAIKRKLPHQAYRTPSMFAGRELAGRVVLLVCPIDSQAPAGRLILPQVQAIRELLDIGAIPMVVQPDQLRHALKSCRTPQLVVTDSQVFTSVRAQVPQQIELTSFSILLASAKGDYPLYINGLEAVDTLHDGDLILIGESCTHQVSCDDIGRTKIPMWLEKFTGCKLHFTTISGLDPLPTDIAKYALMVQCGGCMVTRSQLCNRIRAVASAGVPVTNYGMLIRKITEK